MRRVVYRGRLPYRRGVEVCETDEENFEEEHDPRVRPANHLWKNFKVSRSFLLKARP